MSQTSYNSDPIRKEIDFGAFIRAWELGKDNAGLFLAAGVLALMPQWVISFCFSLVTPKPSTPATTMPEILAQMGQNLPITIVQILVGAIVQGITYVCLSSFAIGAVRRGRADLSDLFAGFRRAVPGAIGGLIFTALFYLGALAFILGAFVVGGLLLVYYCVIADTEKNAFESLSTAVGLVKSCWLPAITMPSSLSKAWLWR